MNVETEIVSEYVGVTHVDDYSAVWPFDDADEHQVRAAVDALERRRARERCAKRFRKRAEELRRDLEQRRRARERLKGTAYEHAPL